MTTGVRPERRASSSTCPLGIVSNDGFGTQDRIDYGVNLVDTAVIGSTLADRLTG